jgi:hypothetical protein
MNRTDVQAQCFPCAHETRCTSSQRRTRACHRLPRSVLDCLPGSTARMNRHNPTQSISQHLSPGVSQPARRTPCRNSVGTMGDSSHAQSTDLSGFARKSQSWCASGATGTRAFGRCDSLMLTTLCLCFSSLSPFRWLTMLPEAEAPILSGGASLDGVNRFKARRQGSRDLRLETQTPEP